MPCAAFAQRRDMHPNRVAERIYAAVPDMFHQFLLTDRASLMQKQIFQNTAFLAGQWNRLTVHHSHPALGIKAQSAASQANIALNKLPPCQAADAGFQFGQMERLGQIIIGAGVQAFHLVRNFTAGRQNQNRRFQIGLSQCAQNCHSIHSGQVQIQQNKVIPLCRQHFQRGFPITAVICFIPCTVQLSGNAFPQGRLILNQQQTHNKRSLYKLCFCLLPL